MNAIPQRPVADLYTELHELEETRALVADCRPSERRARHLACLDVVLAELRDEAERREGVLQAAVEASRA